MEMCDDNVSKGRKRFLLEIYCSGRRYAIDITISHPRSLLTETIQTHRPTRRVIAIPDSVMAPKAELPQIDANR
jgi:hypothetical protein